jgi:NADPH:quinone reductase-like Zn-dependent oxidoreductase
VSSPPTTRQFQSTLRPNGEVELRVVDMPIPQPVDSEIVVEMLAAPIHPSDMGLMFSYGDPRTAERVSRDGEPVTVLRASEPATQMLKSRWNKPMPVGMEGAGRVIAAGARADAQALLGRIVGVWGGASYSRHKKVRAQDAMIFADGVTAIDGAAAFINPLTALGMVEMMREQGFTALAHTTAASTVGQILVRLCRQENIELVNIVRRPEQVELLRAMGAAHVVNSTDDSFDHDLLEALRATQARLAFDAVGGGDLASKILHLMERATPETGAYQHYGSSLRKKVYIYGSMDQSPLVLHRNYGLAWEVGAYLVFNFLENRPPELLQRLKRRISADIKTTFAMTFKDTVSLEQLCDPDWLRRFGRPTTGGKHLIEIAR